MGALSSNSYRFVWRLIQRISLGEKLGGVRALNGQREVAGGVGAEGVGRVEEDEFAARSCCAAAWTADARGKSSETGAMGASRRTAARESAWIFFMG